MQSQKSESIHVCHVITGLATGGAETTLYNLLQTIDASRFTMSVISLSDTGNIGEKIRELGIPVESLGMHTGTLSLPKMIELRRLLSRLKPDIIQSWMYHANLLSLLTARSLGKETPVIWNVRQCLYSLNNEKPNTRWVIRATRLLAGLADGIIYNSEVAQRQHEDLGYPSAHAWNIPNGFDLQTLGRDPDEGSRVRAELNIPDNALVVGHIGRYHPMKDHRTFLRAVSLLTRNRPDLYVILCGLGVDAANPELSPYLAQLDASRLRLLGERSDVPRLFTAMDVFCSSSFSEAFPNVLGEAMASQVPCVTTDVGDSARLVGDTGLSVPPEDPEALAESLSRLLELSSKQRSVLGEQARQRIQQHFSLQRVARTYQDLYISAIEDC